MNNKRILIRLTLAGLGAAALAAGAAQTASIGSQSTGAGAGGRAMNIGSQSTGARAGKLARKIDKSSPIMASLDRKSSGGNTAGQI